MAMHVEGTDPGELGWQQKPGRRQRRGRYSRKRNVLETLTLIRIRGGNRRKSVSGALEREWVERVHDRRTRIE